MDEGGLRGGAWVPGPAYGYADVPPGPLADEPESESGPGVEPEARQGRAGPVAATDLISHPPGLGGGTGSGRYRGRRRLSDFVGRRPARRATAAVVVAVGVVLVGSGVLARTFSDPVTLPVVPPSPSVSPSLAGTPDTISRLGPGPTPSATPTPTPSPTPSPTPPPEPEPEPALTTEPDPPEREPVDISLEAEDAERRGDAVVISRSSASGGEAVDITTGPGSAGSVRFGGVSVDRGGEYELTLVYDDEQCCPNRARVSVGDSSPVVVDFPDTPGGSFRSVTLSMQLPAGTYTIRVSAGADDVGPILDRITITE